MPIPKPKQKQQLHGKQQHIIQPHKDCLQFVHRVIYGLFTVGFFQLSSLTNEIIEESGGTL